MDAEKRVDEAVNTMLKAGGNPNIRMYMPEAQRELRDAMRQIMSDSYIAGSNACYAALKQKQTEASRR